jgi:hypothetical protein
LADADPDHLICEFTLVNVVLRVVPTALTAAMIPIEMPAASKQYSIAVAPELSLIKRTIADMGYLSPARHVRKSTSAHLDVR